MVLEISFHVLVFADFAWLYFDTNRIKLEAPLHRNLADQLTLFKPGGEGGTDFAPHITASPPGFKKLSAPLCFLQRRALEVKIPCDKIQMERVSKLKMAYNIYLSFS